MGLRFQKKVKLLPGVTLNLGKQGLSLSLGPRGLKTNFSKNGLKQSIGIPGTGLRYEIKPKKEK